LESYSNYQAPSAFTDLDTLERDVQALISTFEALVPRNYNDTSLLTKLKALRDLQMVLKTQDLRSDQLQAVRAQVDALRASQLPTSQAPTPVPTTALLPTYSTPSLSVPYQPPFHTPYQPPSIMNQLMPVTTVAAPSSSAEVPSSNFLADLLAGRASTPADTHQTAAAKPYGLTHAHSGSTSSSKSSMLPSESSLMVQLRAAGLLAAVDSPLPNDTRHLGHSNQGLSTSPSGGILPDLSTLLRPPLEEKYHNVELTSAALKR
jgi:hypothetical protein